MMATYFHGSSEIQADNLQTLYLVNPSYGAAYSDSQTPVNMLLLNPAGAGGQHAPSLPNQHLVGVPLGAPPVSAGSGGDPSRPSLHYNLWADPAAGGVAQHQISTAVAVGSGGDVASPVGYRRSQAVPVAAHSHQSTQGLSLSLNNSSPNKNVVGSTILVSAGDGSNTSASLVAKGLPGAGAGSAGGVLFSSKYLKAAQGLLDEFVNVERAMIIKADLAAEGAKGKKSRMAAVGSGEEHSGGDCETRDGNRAGPAELTTAVKQELQMKKEKLLNMLDEVERRYRLYNNQMQVVASSFEQAAGPGSARLYTAVALQTISRQFRCLKDAIAAQIKATRTSLGEDHGSGGGGKGESSMSRLRFIDQQLRQQRELQQLGMVQHSAWRPQRGLPERAVSVLRAWLFDHFLHPYPKDTDKHILAKQTGLTRSQVSNWFINARVRLWKPMVEEMYHEEVKSQDQNASDQDRTNTTNNNNQNDNDHRKNPTVRSTRTSSSAALHSHQQVEKSSRASSLNHHAHPHQQGFSFVGSNHMEQPVTQRSPKRPRSSDVHNSPSSILSMEMEMKPGAGDASNHGGFGAYIVGQIGSRFDPDQQLGQQYHQGNGVSLTLGLPHGEGLSLSEAQQHHHNQHNFMVPGQVMQLGPRLEVGIGDGEFCGISTSQPSDTSDGPYDGIDIGNRKRFAAQLLPDFVA